MTLSTDEQLYERVIAEERELVLPEIGADSAWRLGCRLVDRARERSLPLSIGIQLGRHRVFQAGLEGASANNAAWVDRKVNTVLHFDSASLAVGALYRVQGKDFRIDSGLDPSAYSSYGGAFPLRVAGLVVGAVAVSGLPQLDDHALVVEQLRAHLSGG